MKTRTQPLRVSTPLGDLFVAVHDAAAHRHYDVDAREDVTVIRPRLYVGTDPGFTGSAGASYWKIRGRSYAVLRFYNFLDLTHIKYSTGKNAGRWHAEDNPNGGGYRNQQDKQVEFRTPTYELMDKTVEQALDVFAEEHPAWGELSTYLRSLSIVHTSQGEAARLNHELTELGSRLSVQLSVLDEAASRTPDDLLSLVRT